MRTWKAVQGVTSSTGSALFADNYLPFGQDNGTPTGSETYKFTGKPVSQTTGLYYGYQRWYDPSIGRFISRDPFPGRLSYPQSLNPYVYVLDAPTSVTDPSGLSPWYVDLLESFGPENDILNIAQHFTGVNTDQLVGSTLGPQAQQIFTGSRMLSGGAFLASGVVATAGIVAPAILGTAGSTIVTTGISGCTIEEGACQAGADALVKDLSDVGASETTSSTEQFVTGQIPDKIRSTFEDCGEACLTKDVQASQYGPGGDYPSHFFTTSSGFSTADEARTALALPESNPATFVRSVMIPRGTYVGIGPIFGGSATQIWVPNLSSVIYGPWVPV